MTDSGRLGIPSISLIRRRRIGLGRFGTQWTYLWGACLVTAAFLNLGISSIADMTEFHFPVIEVCDDNQVAAHRGDD